MPEAKVFNAAGVQTGTRALKDSVFGVKPNPHVMHSYVVAYLANQRQGTHAAKSRGETGGSGAKPFRQKGTGRARMGSIRSPARVHGGRAFPPKPRDYRRHVNKKERQLALRSALSDRAADGKLFVVDGLSLDKPEIKKMLGLLEAMGLGSESALVLTGAPDQAVYRSCTNIDGVDCLPARQANAYAVLKAGNLVCTADAVDVLEEAFG